jgi:predicted glycoside hydrolase/deacetylase ChbG (UPF0249 family)
LAKKERPDLILSDIVMPEFDGFEIELRAQIDTALATGIDVTHLDGHMGAAHMPEFVDIYLRLGRDYRVPILLVKDIVPSNPVQYSEAPSVERYNAVVAEARKDGFPIFEMMLETAISTLSSRKRPTSAPRNMRSSELPRLQSGCSNMVLRLSGSGKSATA